MRKFLCFLLLLSSAAFAQDQAFIYVSNPDPRQYNVIWVGPGPNCHENTSKYETYGWVYGLYSSPVRVVINSKATKSPLCVIDIDADLKGPFPRVNGSCYVIHSNPGHGFDTSWITLDEAAPYRSRACQ